MPKAKPLAKSVALEKVLNNSIDVLNAVCKSSSQAVASRAKGAKKHTAETKRLSKKRATLSNRKKAITKKLRKGADVVTRKLLTTTVKEIGVIKKLAAKNNAAKTANATELAAMKKILKTASAYVKGIEKANKDLSKPKKKRRKKRAKPTIAE